MFRRGRYHFCIHCAVFAYSCDSNRAMTPADWPTERDYAWTDEWDPFCVALVEHRTPAEVLELIVREPTLGPDRADRIWPRLETQDYLNYATSIESTATGDWALVVEMNGFQDPLLYATPGRVGDPLPQESGLAFGVPHAVSAAFACAERLTRVRLIRDLLLERDSWLAVGHHPITSSRLEDWNFNG